MCSKIFSKISTNIEKPNKTKEKHNTRMVKTGSLKRTQSKMQSRKYFLSLLSSHSSSRKPSRPPLGAKSARQLTGARRTRRLIASHLWRLKRLFLPPPPLMNSPAERARIPPASCCCTPHLFARRSGSLTGREAP